MPEPLRIDAGELDPDAILAAIDDGRRVVVRTEVGDSNYEVTLRRQGSVYYCDTPTTLHRHESREEMHRCLVNEGYVDADG